MSEKSVARRALFGAAVVAAGAASGVGAYAISNRQAYADGMAAGRQATLSQIKQIKGVSAHTAAQAAQTTNQATKYVALPVVQMLSRIAGDALSILIDALDAAQNILNVVPFAGDIANLLGNLKSLLSTWQSNVSLLSISLDALGEADVDSGLEFLEGLLEILLEAELLAQED